MDWDQMREHMGGAGGPGSSGMTWMGAGWLLATVVLLLLTVLVAAATALVVGQLRHQR